MVRVKPFKAYRYNPAKIADISKVVAPPYDIIKGKKVDEIQSQSPHNIAWIIKNKPKETDTKNDNQYTRARDLLKTWIHEQILIQDEKESFYVYGQNFEVHGEKLFRFGFIGLIELEEFATASPPSGNFAGVLQHEETLPKDIIDRLSLCRESMANFGQIFVIYPDHEGSVDSILEKAMSNAPVMDVTDHEYVRHRIWIVNDSEDTFKISHLMEDKNVIIADGHHRYKTALALSKENQNLESARYRMLTFVNISNPGLVVLPTHRLVQNVEDFSKSRLLEEIREQFDVQSYDEKEEMFKLMKEQFDEGTHSFGLFMDDGKFHALTLRDIGIMKQVMPDSSEELRELDVSILHSLILDKMLGIDKEKLLQGT
ncbi:MAG: DUF1015 family protein, partial [Candidatus Thorarchaeota archaeon]